jgi:hypothetical protein
MDLVKKNLVSIIFGAIAILAVVAIFWPISGFYSRLNADVAKRKTVFQSIKSLDKKRPLPQLELAASAEAKQLDAFPTMPIRCLCRIPSRWAPSICALNSSSSTRATCS